MQPDIPIVARTAAKPAAGGPAPFEESIIGDPDQDTILATAIQTAKNRAADSAMICPAPGDMSSSWHQSTPVTTMMFEAHRVPPAETTKAPRRAERQ